jgi:hypothetical protein
MCNKRRKRKKKGAHQRLVDISNVITFSGDIKIRERLFEPDYDSVSHALYRHASTRVGCRVADVLYCWHISVYHATTSYRLL